MSVLRVFFFFMEEINYMLIFGDGWYKENFYSNKLGKW